MDGDERDISTTKAKTFTSETFSEALSMTVQLVKIRW